VKLLQIALLPAVLVVISTLLVVWHVRSWHAVRDGQADDADRDFHWRRFRRRMQTSIMVGIVGLAVLGGQLLDFRRHPSVYVFYWTAVVLLLLWIILLALADLISSRRYLQRWNVERLVALARLRADAERARSEMARQRQREGNGHAPRDLPPGVGDST
jgi:hypothetical protein